MRNLEVQRLASLFIAAVLTMAAFDMASGLEHWPFGSYPMYSLPYAQSFSALRLYGVTGAGEVLLRRDGSFPPFDQARLTDALARISVSDPSGRTLRVAVRAMLTAHNRAGTPLQALRLYEARWKLHPGLRGTEPPEQRTLLIEVSALDP